MIQVVAGIEAAPAGDLYADIVGAAVEIPRVLEFDGRLEGPEGIDVPSRQGEGLLQRRPQLRAFQYADALRARAVEHDGQRVNYAGMHLVGAPRGQSEKWIARAARHVHLDGHRLARDEAVETAQLVDHGSQARRDVAHVIGLASSQDHGRGGGRRGPQGPASGKTKGEKAGRGGPSHEGSTTDSIPGHLPVAIRRDLLPSLRYQCIQNIPDRRRQLGQRTRLLRAPEIRDTVAQSPTASMPLTSRSPR